MYPLQYPIPPSIAPALQRAIWDDLNLTPEQGQQLGRFLDAPAMTSRGRVERLRLVIGRALVHAGQVVQGSTQPDASGTASGPLSPAH